MVQVFRKSSEYNASSPHRALGEQTPNELQDRSRLAAVCLAQRLAETNSRSEETTWF